MMIFAIGYIGHFCGKSEGVFKANKEKLTHKLFDPFMKLTFPARHAKNKLMCLLLRDYRRA
jgi:hypothetical protein